MDIQKMVAKAIGGNMKTLGAESITINGQAVEAILSESQNDRGINGGSRDERSLDGQFPTVHGLKLKIGNRVEARDKKWKLEEFRKGKAMTTIVIIEPNRPKDD